MIKPKRHPYGYKKLLVYQKAEELQQETSHLTSLFLPVKTLYSLSDQMNRSSRSTKQNVVEGWKRNSAREYYEFLGYSIASNAELEEDCDDIIRGVYPNLMGKTGIKGEMGEMGLDQVENLRFYPLNTNLPPIIQLKLRAKELNFLLDRLQQSLLEKMRKEGTLSIGDKLTIQRNRVEEAEKWYRNMLEEKGLVRLENGRVVKKEEYERNKDKWVKWEEGD